MPDCRITIVDTGSLIDSIDRMWEAMPKPALRKGFRRGSHLPKASGPLGIGSPPDRSEPATLWEYKKLVKDSALGKLYRKLHGDVDWPEYLARYAVSIKYRSLSSGFDAYFDVQHRYIKRLVDEAQLDLKSLQPDGYKYDCSSLFPYRGPILWSEVTHLTGHTLLFEHISPERVGEQVIWGVLIGDEEFRNFLTTLWNHEIDKRVEYVDARLRRVEFALSLEPDPKLSAEYSEWRSLRSALRTWQGMGVGEMLDRLGWWKQIIRGAWRLAASLHDAGRWLLMEEEMGLIYSLVPLSPTIAELLAETLQAFSEGKHGEMSCMKLGLCCIERPLLSGSLSPDEVRDSLPQAISIHLAVDALVQHNALLEQIDRSDLADALTHAKEVWSRNPLAVFLAAAIWVSELPARICWHAPSATPDDVTGGEKATPEKNNLDDLGLSVPVGQLDLILNAETRLVFRGDLSQFGDEELIPPPLQEKRLAVLQLWLGHKCLNLLTAEQTEDFDAIWGDLKPPPAEEPKAVKEVAKGEEPAIPESKEEVEIEEWREECEKLARECKQAIARANVRFNRWIRRNWAERPVTKSRESPRFQRESKKLNSVRERFSELEKKCERSLTEAERHSVLTELGTCRDDADSIVSEDSSEASNS